VIKINLFSSEITKLHKKEKNKINEPNNTLKDMHKSITQIKLPLPANIKTSKYLIHYITLILEIRSLNLESFDKNSNKDNPTKDLINDRVDIIYLK